MNWIELQSDAYIMHVGLNRRLPSVKYTNIKWNNTPFNTVWNFSLCAPRVAVVDVLCGQVDMQNKIQYIHTHSQSSIAYTTRRLPATNRRSALEVCGEFDALRKWCIFLLANCAQQSSSIVKLCVFLCINLLEMRHLNLSWRSDHTFLILNCSVWRRAEKYVRKNF